MVCRNNTYVPVSDEAKELVKIAKGLILLAEGIDRKELEIKHGSAMLTKHDVGFNLLADVFLAYVKQPAQPKPKRVKVSKRSNK